MGVSVEGSHRFKLADECSLVGPQDSATATQRGKPAQCNASEAWHDDTIRTTMPVDPGHHATLWHAVDVSTHSLCEICHVPGIVLEKKKGKKKRKKREWAMFTQAVRGGKRTGERGDLDIRTDM